MTHTNVSIPTLSETSAELYIHRLEAEKKFWEDRATALRRELANIPDAVKQYGYVDLPCGMKLVPALSPSDTDKQRGGDEMRTTKAELVDLQKRERAAALSLIRTARSQAIDDCIKVVREELVQQEDMSGCDETFSRRQLEKYRFAADRLSVIASRLEALKDTKEKEVG